LMEHLPWGMHCFLPKGCSAIGLVEHPPLCSGEGGVRIQILV
jgi:hypothetical protein